LSCLLHIYTHNTLWWMAHQIVEKYELPISGVVLFLPVVSVEVWFVYVHIRVKQFKSVWLHVWSRRDTLYYAVLATIGLMLAGLTNVMEAVDNKNVMAHTP